MAVYGIYDTEQYGVWAMCTKNNIVVHHPNNTVYQTQPIVAFVGGAMI